MMHKEGWVPKVSGYQHRALLQSKLLEPAVVKSVHTCRRIFPFFFFSFFQFFFLLLNLQRFYLLLLNYSYPFLSEFHENELGTISFW